MLKQINGYVFSKQFLFVQFICLLNQMCSGPKCPCVKNSKNERIFSATTAGYYQQRQQQQVGQQQAAAVSNPTEQSTIERPSLDKLSQVRQHLVKKRQNNRKYSNKLKQKTANKTKIESKPNQEVDDADPVPTQLEHDPAHDRQQAIESVHNLIQGIPLQKLTSLKFTVKPPLSVLWSSYSILSFFAGIDASVPQEFLENQDVAWTKVQQYFEQPSQFISLLHSFEYIAVNRIVKPENIKQAKKWLARLEFLDEKDFETTIASSFVPLIKAYLHLLDLIGQDVAEEPVEEHETRPAHETLDRLEDVEDQHLEEPVEEVEQPRDPINSVLERSLNSFLKPEDFEHKAPKSDQLAYSTCSDNTRTQEKKAKRIQKQSSGSKNVTPKKAKLQPQTGLSNSTQKKDLPNRTRAVKTSKFEVSTRIAAEGLTDIQKLRLAIKERYALIAQTQSRDRSLEWSMTREAMQKGKQQELKATEGQLGWHDEQKKKQEKLVQEQRSKLRIQDIENKEFVFLLTNRSNKKFSDLSFENQEYKQYLNQYASKYDEHISHAEDIDLYIKSLQSELKQVDRRKNQVEQQFQEFSSRVEEYQSKSPFKV